MMASNLTIELNYLLDQLYKEPIEVVLKSYKYLTLFIGSNDICFRCSNDLPWLTSKQFEDYLKSTLEIIKREIPNTVVNLLGVFNVSQVYNFHKEEYCKGWGLVAEYECSCAFAPGKFLLVSFKGFVMQAKKYQNKCNLNAGVQGVKV
jgi:phospholipase B1